MPCGDEAVGKQSEGGDGTLHCGDEAVAEIEDEEMLSKKLDSAGGMENGMMPCGDEAVGKEEKRLCNV